MLTTLRRVNKQACHRMHGVCYDYETLPHSPAPHQQTNAWRGGLPQEPHVARHPIRTDLPPTRLANQARTLSQPPYLSDLMAQNRTKRDNERPFSVLHAAECSGRRDVRFMYACNYKLPLVLLIPQLQKGRALLCHMGYQLCGAGRTAASQCRAQS